ncbi:DUF4124 domain-containing protein [Acinetobacter sp. WZC-1]|uniref:DUF4124 domain-containing protein n=1 Tax=Acinetobacter sp. WZC-1 TaxID=3459034 RepID=UPI00403DDA66
MQTKTGLKLTLLPAVIIIAALLSTQSFARQYYKWVDHKGSTHYTTTPPPKNARQQGKVETYGHPNSAMTPAQSVPASTQNNNQHPSAIPAPDSERTQPQPAVMLAPAGENTEPSPMPAPAGISDPR